MILKTKGHQSLSNINLFESRLNICVIGETIDIEHDNGRFKRQPQPNLPTPSKRALSKSEMSKWKTLLNNTY